jgi:hypothetical protein
MKKIVSLVTVAFILLAGTACQQQSSPELPAPELETTAYQPNKDVYLVFRGFIFKRVTSLLPLDVIGEVAFELQKGTHEAIRDVSQVEIDHYYIWVCLEDECIPVDPFSYSY